MAPSVLFVSPAPPDGQASGLRIRASLNLQALQRHHRVHSLHLHNGWSWDSRGLPFLPAIDPELVGRRLLQLVRPVGVSDLRNLSHLAQLQLLGWQWWRPSTRVHLFRIASLLTAGPLLGWTGLPATLDLDEVESSTRLRLAELAELRNEPALARRYRREAAFFARLEDVWLPRMQRVFVSSDLERQALQLRFPDISVQVLPNLPRAVPQSPLSFDSAQDLLFVGNLDYYPNRDGLEWLLREVWPLLRQSAPEIQLLVAGSGGWRPPPLPGVVDLGCVEDLAPVYARARLALVPLRAGGGTRIKALEAFAHGRPVVSTRIGVEGLGLEEGLEHCSVADSPALFAQRCLEWWEDGERCRRAGISAYTWLRELPAWGRWEHALAFNTSSEESRDGASE